MPMFQKKPVVVEARRVPRYSEPPIDLAGKSIEHYLKESIDLAAWCGGTSHMMCEDDEDAHCEALVTGPHIRIPTLEGDHAALPGDWIIKGIAGEFYPCKPDIFDATYQAVEVVAFTEAED